MLDHPKNGRGKGLRIARIDEQAGRPRLNGRGHDRDLTGPGEPSLDGLARDLRRDREDLVGCRLRQPLEEEVRGTPPDAHEVVEAEPMEGVDDDGRAGYPRCQAPHDAG